MKNFMIEKVLSVHHWTDTLFSFTTTRNDSFRFKNGHFVMLGLADAQRPLMRAYSIVSANYESHLEFFSIKVPNGSLTKELQHVRVGDEIVLSKKATGTLVLDNLLPGRNLYLLASGTGLAPFLSIIKDLDIYENFERVVLIHGCRYVAELAYQDFITSLLPRHEYLGEWVKEKLLYYPTVTREVFKNQGRITTLLESQKLINDLNMPELNPAYDRFMLCGSPALLKDLSTILRYLGFREYAQGIPGHFVIERAFIET